MIDDNGDPRTDAEAARLCVESYVRRPSVKPVAVETICGFMNNIVLARRPPDPEYGYHAAMFFIFKNEAVWAISGDAAALVFVDRHLTRASDRKLYPMLGSSPAFRIESGEAFTLPRGDLSLFLCTGAVLDQAGGAAGIEEALAGAETPGDWMKAVQGRCASPGSALAAFIPPPGKGPRGM